MSATLPMMSYQNAKTLFFGMGAQMYLTHEVKEPLMQAISILFDAKASRFQKLRAVKTLWDAFESMKGLPEPTKENTWHPNTHNLIDLRDWLFEKCHLNVLRMGFIRRVMNFVIMLYDFDPPWRFIFDSLREEAMGKEWKPKGYEDNWVTTYTWWAKE